MFQLILERRSGTLLTALFIVSFALMTASVRLRGGATLIERGVLSLSGPLLQAAGAPARWTNVLWRSYVAYRDLSRENAAQRKELESLRGLSVQIRELREKVKRLEGLLGSTSKLSTSTRLAHIIGREASPYGQTLLIDLGSAEGMRRNLPVLHQAGVVGRISRVGRSISQVLLLTDSRSAVDVIVQRTRAQGVFSVSPEGGGRVRYLPADGDVARGDLLISSGMGGIFPKGLPVARVTGVRRKGEHLFRQVEAEPAVNFHRIEEVLVLMTAPQDFSAK